MLVNFFAENLCQVLVGDAAFIHRRLKLLLDIDHLRRRLTFLLHHDNRRLTHFVVYLAAEATAVNYVW